MPISKETYTAKITLTAANLTSLEKAQGAVITILRDVLPPKDGFQMTITLKADYPLADKILEVENLMMTHRGVHCATKQQIGREVEANENAVAWQDTPLGKLSQTPREN